MSKAKKQVHDPVVIKIGRADLKDLIRDALYAFSSDKQPFVIIPFRKVKGIAKRIARHAVIGH